MNWIAVTLKDGSLYLAREIKLPTREVGEGLSLKPTLMLHAVYQGENALTLPWKYVNIEDIREVTITQIP